MYDDEFAGQGGSYTVDKSGKRKRVETTEDHPYGNCAREAVVTVQPAEQLIQPTNAEV